MQGTERFAPDGPLPILPPMTSGLVLTIVRAAILVGMVAAFAISLAWSVSGDERLSLVASPATGADPGVRVLLADRRSYDNRTEILPHHERLTLAVLRPARLVAPDQGDDPAFSLDVDRGEQITIKPDVEGLVFSSSTWGQEQRWTVRSLRLVPRMTTLDAETARISAARWPTARFEDADREAVFAIGSRRYRGSLEVRFVSSKQVQAINLLPIEAYVEGVIAIEMKASYPMEALKAQAIASRTSAYAKAWAAHLAKRHFDLSDALDDQDYHGHGLGGDATARAVRETAGLILLTPRLRQPFVPQFCAANGGWTEAIEAVFPGLRDVTGRESLADIMMVQDDPFCARGAAALGYGATHGEQQVILRPEDIRERLQAWVTAQGEQTTIGYVTDIAIGQREPRSGRVRTVVISYTSNQRREMPAHEFRRMMGPHIVRSTLWKSLETRQRGGERRVNDWVITCTGYGHGVGMSQISAWAMAKEGFTHLQILRTFYHGAEVGPWGR